MNSSPADPILPIVIVPLEDGKEPKTRRSQPPDMRHWQIEEFLRQTGKAENTQRTYRGQLARFAAWYDTGLGRLGVEGEEASKVS